MKTKKELLDDLIDVRSERYFEKVKIEVLIDIRDELEKIFQAIIIKNEK